MSVHKPNPVWMQGNVDGKYNILNGLVNGHFDFEFEVGQQCTPVSSSPFGGMPIIADIKPVDSENDVSVFTTPQVIFNMPVNQTIEFKDETGETKKYRIVLKHFKVGTEDGQALNGTLTWNDENNVLVFKTRDILPGETSIKASAKVTFEEYKNGNWYVVSNNGKVSEESKEIVFITGKEPTNIPQENILYSYPGYRAFNYYKNETSENYLKLNFGQPKLFNPGNDWVQKIKIIPVSGGQPVYADFSYDAANIRVNFSIPATVSNNTIYSLDIVNIPVNEAAALDENVEQQTDVVQVGDEHATTDIEITTQQAEESRSELHEKSIYNMGFRTSNYSTFDEKLKGLTYSNGVTWELAPLIHSLTVNITGERFDCYEVINLNSKTMVTSSLILNETPWYKTYIEPLITLSPDNFTLIQAKPFSPPPLSAYFFQSGGTRKLTDEEISTGYANGIEVVSGMKNYIAKYTSDYMYSLQGRIANKFVDHNVPSGELRTLFYSNFTPIKYGNYPVNIHFTLPGKEVPLKTIRHNIIFD